MKEYMIRIIKKYQHYSDGKLESMSEEQVRDIFERVLSWLEWEEII